MLLVWGLIRGGEDGAVLLVAGMALASLAGLETALREHFTGHAPHALLIAAVPAVARRRRRLVPRRPARRRGRSRGGAVLLGGTVALRRAFRPRR